MKKSLRLSAWILLALCSLVFFTLIKFPEDRLKPIVQGYINQILAPQSLVLNAEKGALSLFFGLSYTLEGVTLAGADLSEPIQLEKIKVAPSLFSLLSQKLDAAITIQHQSGKLRLQLAMPTPQESAEITLSAEADQFPLDQTRLTRLFGLSIGGIIDGTLSIEGNAQIPSSLSGAAAVKIQKLKLDQQSLLGFSLPQMVAPVANLRFVATKGKLNIEQLQIEKGGDIYLSISGSLALGQTWEASQLDLKTSFGFSEKLAQTLSFLDAFLGAGKQGDGSYAYTVTGSVAAPFPNPIFAK